MRDALQADECSRRLRALAEPERLRIIQCLQRGPLSVGELAERLGNELANVSHHLRVLRHARLVESKRRGKFVVYSLSPDVYLPPSQRRGAVGALDLGCCRLQLG